MKNFLKKIQYWTVGAMLLLFSLHSVTLFAQGGKSSKNAEKTPVIRILAIGNSFSEDAVEEYLYGLAKAAGHRVIIGNLYIGGAPLSLHLKNAQGDLPAYEYRKVGLDGKKARFANTSLSKALADEAWDYISVQQASPNSGQFDTYLEPLPPLMAYVRERASNPKVKYIWHQTWAYAQNSTHSGFVNYDKDQLKMYAAIADASRRAMKLGHFDLLVPAGTAIQNARTSFIGDNMNRDGYHLDLNKGRYTASCAWFEVLFKQDVRQNSYRPEKVSAREAEVAQAAAHAARQKPYQISDLKQYH